MPWILSLSYPEVSWYSAIAWTWLRSDLGYFFHVTMQIWGKLLVSVKIGVLRIVCINKLLHWEKRSRCMLINWAAFIDPLCRQMYDVSVCNKSVLTMIMTQSFLLFFVILGYLCYRYFDTGKRAKNLETAWLP